MNTLGLTQKLKKFIDNYLYSEWHIIVVAMLSVVGWATGTTIQMITVLAILLSVIMVYSRDMTPTLPILVMVSCTVSMTKIPSNVVTLAIFIVIPLVLAIVLRLIRFRKDPFKISLYGIAVGISVVAMLLGGLFAKEDVNLGNKYGMLVTIGIAPFIVYMAVTQCLDSKVDLRTYFAKIMVWFGMVVLIEIIIFYARLENLEDNVDLRQLGWMNSNSGASALLLSVPFCFYLAVKNEHYSWFYISLGIIQTVGQLLFGSRGGMMFAALAIIGSLIVLIVKTKNRRVLLINLAIWFCIGIILLYIGREKIELMIKQAFSAGLSLTGRDILYREAFRVFIKNPIFGAGFGYLGIDFHNAEVGPIYFFHSTFFQILGSLGIVGIISFAFVYYARYRVFLKKGCVKNAFNLMSLCAILAFEGYAMMNTGTFVGIPFLMIMHIMVGVCEKTNETSLLESGIKPLTNV